MMLLMDSPAPPVVLYGRVSVELRGVGACGVAARGVVHITGATPAFAAVSRHNAFSSLLSSLRGSHRLRVSGRVYDFVNRSGQIRFMKPQARRETN
jgi:hypothetical protein